MGHVFKLKNQVSRLTSGRAVSAGGAQETSGSVSLLQPSDFRLIGAFRMPTSHSYQSEYYGLNFPSGLTGRYVNGQLCLYTMAVAQQDPSTFGTIVEFSVPADAFLTTTPPYPDVSNGGSQVLNHFVDIFQNELARFVGDGNSDPGPGGRFGLTNSAAQLTGLYWDPIDSRMYWTSQIAYNLSYYTSDTTIGYSTITSTNPPTLNGGASSTGVGMGMWKLSPPNGYPTTYGNRWCMHPFPIPIAFANAYCGGRRLGIGFGGAMSIISNGPFSQGPALFAIHPPQPGTDPDHDYMATAPVRLCFYPPLKTPPQRAPRPPSLYCTNDFDDENPAMWNWKDGLPVGTWIDGPNKHGIIAFCSLSGGNCRTTIQASPVPTHTTFAVADPGDTRVGDYARWATDVTNGQTNYPWVAGYVQNISGNFITIDPTTIVNGDVIGPDVSAAIPFVGGEFLLGGWYQGGGESATRWYNALYMYDPVDLANVALGLSTENVTPYSMTSFSLAGQTYPFPGGFNTPAGGLPTGVWFDTTTNRLYALHISFPGVPRLIYVYSVNC
jgi:hypothetical protein